jgi:DNA-binding NarL/FixJ family response regulator
MAENDQPTTIRLLICDDHKLLTDALALIVGSDPAIELVADPVQDPDDAIEICRKETPDVVLMDLVLNARLNGIEATRIIKDEHPETNVVIMTGQQDDRSLVEAVEAGACGFLNKTTALEEVIDTVKQAAEGEVLIDPATLSRVLATLAREREARRDVERIFAHLTDREREILQHLASGKRNEAIAGELYISPQTVQTHIRNILRKLQVHSKLEAVALAVKLGEITA